jgi:hypothetical protein
MNTHPWKSGNVYRLPFGVVSPESISWEFRSAEERKRRPYDWGAVEDWHLDRALAELLAEERRLHPSEKLKP